MTSRAATRFIAQITSRKPIQSFQSRFYASSASSDRPLYPSVQVLLHTHNLSASDIEATGPGGRLLKGDVLAHLGNIKSSYPKELSQRLSKLSHLDLSNVKLAEPKKPESEAGPAAKEPAQSIEEVFDLSLPIDLKPALKLQQRLQETLGHAPPLSELITRAINMANIDLPAASRPPTADELFEDIVGGPSKGSRLSDGRFVPAINQLEPVAIPVKQMGIIDELVAPARSQRRAPVPQPVSFKTDSAVNDFTIAVPLEDRKRATVFLQRMKSVLEIEPGRLLL